MVHTFCPLSYTSQGIFLPIVGLFGLFHVLFVSALGAYRLVPIGTKLYLKVPLTSLRVSGSWFPGPAQLSGSSLCSLLFLVSSCATLTFI